MNVSSCCASGGERKKEGPKPSPALEPWPSWPWQALLALAGPLGPPSLLPPSGKDAHGTKAIASRNLDTETGRANPLGGHRCCRDTGAGTGTEVGGRARGVTLRHEKHPRCHLPSESSTDQCR